MATYEKKVLMELAEYLAIPEDKAVLEKQYVERSEEVLKLKQYLLSKGLLLKYEQAIDKAESRENKHFTH